MTLIDENTNNIELTQSIDKKELCLRLAHCETEQEVTEVLQEYQLLEDIFWEGKFAAPAVVGGQQGDSVAALAELVMNSFDSTLMSECLKRGIDPYSDDAPKTFENAGSSLLGIDRDRFHSVVRDTGGAKEIAQQFGGIVLSGEPKSPSVSIFDFGQGQAPHKFKDTFLDIAPKTGSNKMKIPFLQGTYGAGGTGGFRFTGELGYRLIISRENPEIPGSDSTNIGFTLIRRFKSTPQSFSEYQYLHFNGEIGSFPAGPLKILPEQTFKEGGYSESFLWEHGCFVKMFNYQKVPAFVDLMYKLSMNIMKPAMPFCMFERTYASKKQAHTSEIVLLGIKARLRNNPKALEQVTENGPLTGVFDIEGEPVNYEIYVFRDRFEDKVTGPTIRNYHQGQQIVYMLNGQNQHYKSNSFFTRNSVGLHALKDDILMIVDVSKLSDGTREKLFKSDRQSVVDDDCEKKLEEKIEGVLKDPVLVNLNRKREQEKVKSLSDNSGQSAELFQKLVNNNPLLIDLLTPGKTIMAPVKKAQEGIAPIYEGRFPPTKFELKNANAYTEGNPRNWENGRKAIVQFETDAPNDYFLKDREGGYGWFNAFQNGIKLNNYSTTPLKDGQWSLNIDAIPENHTGKPIKFNVEFWNTKSKSPLTQEFWLTPIELKPHTPGSSPFNTGSESDTEGNKKQKQADLPKVKSVHKSDWKDHGFDDTSGAAFYPSTNTIVINMDNKFLDVEKRNKKDKDAELDAVYLASMKAYVMLTAAANSSKEGNVQDAVMEGSKEHAKLAIFLSYDVPKETSKLKF